MFTDAGSINQAKKYAFDIDDLFNGISCSARNIAYNGPFFIKQNIKQG